MTLQLYIGGQLITQKTTEKPRSKVIAMWKKQYAHLIRSKPWAIYEIKKSNVC